MKPFKTFKGAGALALALFLFTSCSKNMDESSSKDANDVALLAGGPPAELCAPFIGLNLPEHPNNAYFFVNDRMTEENQQEIVGATDFTDNWLMQVSAGGVGTAYHSFVAEAIGVMSPGENALNQTFINSGESLILKLGTSYLNEVLMRGVDLQFHGIPNTQGMVEFYRKGVMVASDPITSATYTNFGRTKFFAEPFNLSTGKYFDEVRLTCSAGRYQLRGKNNAPGLGLLPPTRFYLVNPVRQVVHYGGFNAADNYTVRFDNNILDLGFKQTFTGASELGNWNLGNTNRWLKYTAGPSTSLSFSLMTSRFGVFSTGAGDESRFINLGESLTIEKGDDLVGFDKFGGVELKVAYKAAGPKNPLTIQLFDGLTLVGTYPSIVPGAAPFVATTVIFPDGGLVFDRVVITGTGDGAAIGSGTGPFIRFFPGCN